ncbi:hypothetical protein JR316_0003965, partial [Psilocybe cubensis]
MNQYNFKLLMFEFWALGMLALVFTKCPEHWLNMIESRQFLNSASRLVKRETIPTRGVQCPAMQQAEVQRTAMSVGSAHPACERLNSICRKQHADLRERQTRKSSHAVHPDVKSPSTVATLVGSKHAEDHGRSSLEVFLINGKRGQARTVGRVITRFLRSGNGDDIFIFRPNPHRATARSSSDATFDFT